MEKMELNIELKPKLNHNICRELWYRLEVVHALIG